MSYSHPHRPNAPVPLVPLGITEGEKKVIAISALVAGLFGLLYVHHRVHRKLQSEGASGVTTSVTLTALGF